MCVQRLFVKGKDAVRLAGGLLLGIVDLPRPGRRGGIRRYGVVGGDVGAGEGLERRGEHDASCGREQTVAASSTEVIKGSLRTRTAIKERLVECAKMVRWQAAGASGAIQTTRVCVYTGVLSVVRTTVN